MSEKQNVEWKEIWKDEYLKWICGFANAQGGILCIGKNDEGKVVGIDNSKRLSEELPNKIRDMLGIVVDINLHTCNGKNYFEIVVPQYPQGVSYKGKYYYRTGSTNQLLNGMALQEFFNRKRGVSWDAAIVPNARISNLNQKAIQKFKEKPQKREE